MKKEAIAVCCLLLASLLAAPGARAELYEPTISTTAHVKVRVPGRYHFRWALFLSSDPAFTYESWSEAMDTAGPRMRMRNRKLRHELGSIEPLDPALFKNKLWLEVSRYRPATDTWTPCSARIPLKIAPYALYSETTGRRYAGVAVVAKSGAEYSNPTHAMNARATWCGVPSPSNRCLLRIMPGEYYLGYGTYYGIVMREYIDIEGSGEGSTVLWTSVEQSNVGAISGADHAELRNVTVENRGAGAYKSTVVNSGVSPRYSNVTIRTIGDGSTSIATGMRNTNASPELREVTIEASGAATLRGLWNSSSGIVRIDRSVITAADCTVLNESGVTTYIAGTRLENGGVCNTGTAVCAGVTNEAYGFYPSTCP